MPCFSTVFFLSSRSFHTSLLKYKVSDSPLFSDELCSVTRLRDSFSCPQLIEMFKVQIWYPSRVMVSPVPLTQPNPGATTAERLSQIQMLFFRCALSPTTPSSSICACVCFFHIDSRLQHIRKVGRWKIRVTRPKQVHFIRAHIFVVGRIPSRFALDRNPVPQCFACFVTSTRQSATN